MAFANPAMSEAVYRRAGYADAPTHVMTVNGTAMKTLALVAVLLITGSFTWAETVRLQAGIAAGQVVVPGMVAGLFLLGLIGGFVTALVAIFAPRTSPVTAPLYAAFEGLILGVISAFFESRFPGVVTQAIGLTIGILAVMLFIYATGIIRVTEKFRIGVTAAIGAVCLVYLLDIVGSLLGSGIPYIHQSGWIGIGFSLAVIVIAALRLVLNFDFVVRGAEVGAPKYMEWYGGFALMLTLIWLYLEILDLLAKLNGRRD